SSHTCSSGFVRSTIHSTHTHLLAAIVAAAAVTVQYVVGACVGDCQLPPIRVIGVLTSFLKGRLRCMYENDSLPSGPPSVYCAVSVVDPGKRPLSVMMPTDPAVGRPFRFIMTRP